MTFFLSATYVALTFVPIRNVDESYVMLDMSYIIGGVLSIISGVE